MESQYLKQSLAKLATLKARSEEIDSKENRERTRTQYNLKPGGEYPAMCGQFLGLIMGAHWDIESATRSAERLEVIDREHERLISIFEGLDIDLDESALAALELMNKRTWGKYDSGNVYDNSPYRSERSALSAAFSKAIADVQESEREFEYEQAMEALEKTGFVLDEETEEWRRGVERVTVGRQYKNHVSAYPWTYDGFDLNGVGVGDSGTSGDFHRLLALITPSQPGSASTVTETPTEPEIEMGGCEAIGVGGIHSDGYAEGRSCVFCGRKAVNRG